MKRLLSLILSVAMLGGVLTSAGGYVALADSDDAAGDLPDISAVGDASESGDLPILIPDAPRQPVINLPRRAVRAAAASSLPASYDPRTEASYLPPVRNQGSWNTCWIVAAVAAAEIDGLKNGLLATTPQNTDLSERHAVYFMTTQTDDPLGNSSGDYNNGLDARLNAGGNPTFASLSMMNWHGVASEAATNSYYSGLSTVDWLDPAYAYAAELHLENTCAMDVATDVQRGALKALLLEHGSAVLCMYMDSNYLFAGSPSEKRGTEEEPADPGEGVETGGPNGEAVSEEVDPAQDEASDTSDEREDIPVETPAPEEGAPDTSEEADPAEMPAAEGDADEGSPDGAEAPEPDADDGLALDGAADMPADETAAEADDETAREEPVPDETPDMAEEPAAEDIPALDGAADDFTVCYYQTLTTGTNHEVLIVGWDDDYPAENFGYSSAGVQPDADGAWLCRNSYGASWAGGDGYFWISYYDRSVSYATGGTVGARVTVFEFASADNYDNNYEYDGAVSNAYISTKTTFEGKALRPDNPAAGDGRYYANVFTASAGTLTGQTEILRAVSTFTTYASVSYTVSVYTSLTDPADPTSGTLAAEMSGTFEYAGVHTVALPEAVYIEEGTQFSVVFRIGVDTSGMINIPLCIESTTYGSVNAIAAGQSFVSVTGTKWKDCIRLAGTPNVRIKAFTDNYAGPTPAASADGSHITVSGSGTLEAGALSWITEETIVVLDSRLRQMTSDAAQKLRTAGEVVVTPYALSDAGDDYSSVMRRLRSITGIPELRIVGDASGDDIYDIRDLTALVSGVLARGAYDAVYDVNGDSAVNVLDLAVLARFMAGTVDSIGLG